MRGWESVLNTCFPYRVHFEPRSAVALMSARRSSRASSLTLYRVVERPGENGRGNGHWFISFLNNSLLFSPSFDRGYLLIYRSRRVENDSFLFTIRRRRGDEIHRLFHCSFPLPLHSPTSFSIRPDVRDFISPRQNHCRHERRLSLMVGVCWAAGPLIKYTPARLFDEFNEGRIQEFARHNGGPAISQLKFYHGSLIFFVFLLTFVPPVYFDGTM